MFKEFFTAFKDYKEMVWKPSIEWVKKHWRAYLVFVVLVEVVCFMPGIILEIRDKIDEIKVKRNKEKYLLGINED